MAPLSLGFQGRQARWVPHATSPGDLQSQDPSFLSLLHRSFCYLQHHTEPPPACPLAHSPLPQCAGTHLTPTPWPSLLSSLCLWCCLGTGPTLPTLTSWAESARSHFQQQPWLLQHVTWAIWLPVSLLSTSSFSAHKLNISTSRYSRCPACHLLPGMPRPSSLLGSPSIQHQACGPHSLPGWPNLQVWDAWLSTFSSIPRLPIVLNRSLGDARELGSKHLRPSTPASQKFTLRKKRGP